MKFKALSIVLLTLTVHANVAAAAQVQLSVPSEVGSSLLQSLATDDFSGASAAPVLDSHGNAVLKVEQSVVNDLVSTLSQTLATSGPFADSCYTDEGQPPVACPADTSTIPNCNSCRHNCDICVVHHFARTVGLCVSDADAVALFEAITQTAAPSLAAIDSSSSGWCVASDSATDPRREFDLLSTDAQTFLDILQKAP